MQMLRQANEKDLFMVQSLIGQAGLNKEGIEAFINDFVLLENEEGKLLAIAGVERVKEDGLLRSLVFLQELKQEQLLIFFQGLIENTRQKQLQNLYLLTENVSLQSFFELFDFTCVQEVPDHIEKNEHYQKNIIKGKKPIVMERVL